MARAACCPPCATARRLPFGGERERVKTRMFITTISYDSDDTTNRKRARPQQKTDRVRTHAKVADGQHDEQQPRTRSPCERSTPTQKPTNTPTSPSGATSSTMPSVPVPPPPQSVHQDYNNYSDIPELYLPTPNPNVWVWHIGWGHWCFYHKDNQCSWPDEKGFWHCVPCSEESERDISHMWLY